MDETIQYKEGGEGKRFCAVKGTFALQKVPSWIMDETILIQYKEGEGKKDFVQKKGTPALQKSTFLNYGRNNTV